MHNLIEAKTMKIEISNFENLNRLYIYQKQNKNNYSGNFHVNSVFSRFSGICIIFDEADTMKIEISNLENLY